jgi:hypothetical protein
MKLSKPKNSNYAAIVVEIKHLIPLEGCDNVQAAIIMNNQVIVSKDVKVGDVGIYFPVECALSKEYLSHNNLYRVHKNKVNLNNDITSKGGYFEENGRVRCIKFLNKHKSEGLYMPITSISDFLEEHDELFIGDEFDSLNGIEICRKYVIPTYKNNTNNKERKHKVSKKIQSKVIETQFRFHENTSMLYKNLHKISPDSLISITYKLHGTSGISSNVLCKKVYDKKYLFGEWLYNCYTKLVSFGKVGFILNKEKYDYLYASRKVIKNPEVNPNTVHYYGEDIWGIAHKELEPFLDKGMTLYYEIVGYTPNGRAIQKDYDYGCDPGTHKIFIYRITYTNPDGKVYEFSAKQVQQWCKSKGLNPVPELFYGYAREFSDERLSKNNWEYKFLENIKKTFNEKRCHMCKNDVPEEGAVIRIEGIDLDVYKAKSNAFYERETALLDKGESNIEDEN